MSKYDEVDQELIVMRVIDTNASSADTRVPWKSFYHAIVRPDLVTLCGLNVDQVVSRMQEAENCAVCHFILNEHEYRFLSRHGVAKLREIARANCTVRELRAETLHYPEGFPTRTFEAYLVKGVLVPRHV